MFSNISSFILFFLVVILKGRAGGKGREQPPYCVISRSDSNTIVFTTRLEKSRIREGCPADMVVVGEQGAEYHVCLAFAVLTATLLNWLGKPRSTVV
jgi:hypothetical protein